MISHFQSHKLSRKEQEELVPGLWKAAGTAHVNMAANNPHSPDIANTVSQDLMETDLDSDHIHDARDYGNFADGNFGNADSLSSAADDADDADGSGAACACA